MKKRKSTYKKRKKKKIKANESIIELNFMLER